MDSSQNEDYMSLGKQFASFPEVQDNLRNMKLQSFYNHSKMLQWNKNSGFETQEL